MILNFAGLLEGLRREKLVEAILACESEEGGFSERPHVKPPYLEPTYYSVELLTLLGAGVRWPISHVHFIVSLQNSNGGFRRSSVAGISDFANTYRALKTLKRLVKWIRGP